MSTAPTPAPKPKRERRTKLQMLAHTLGTAPVDDLHALVAELAARKPKALELIRQLIDQHRPKGQDLDS